jgi:translation initiation factor IF-3
LRRQRTNNRIRAKELRVIDQNNDNLGVLSLKEALEKANQAGLDLIEISPFSKPPVARIADFGKFQYEAKKKAKRAKANASNTETKSVQVKINTGNHDLELKAKKASKWLEEGHRIKMELYLVGRAKYLDKNFLQGRLERVLNLITTEYKIADNFKKGPKGIMVTIEKAK